MAASVWSTLAGISCPAVMAASMAAFFGAHGDQRGLHRGGVGQRHNHHAVLVADHYVAECTTSPPQLTGAPISPGPSLLGLEGACPAE